MPAPRRPRVDVAIVTYNTAALTAQALRHLVDDDQGADLRVLVHDNASSDGTVARLRAEVPEADVVAGAENLGFAGGVNRILARSDAPWVLLLNSDAWPRPGAVARMVATAEAHPRAAAVAPRLERPDGALEASTHPFPSLTVAALLASGLAGVVGAGVRDRLLLEGTWMHDRPRAVPWAVGAALLVRRPALDDIGGLDERFFMYAEDLEWCWRAHRRGWEIWFDPTAVVVHVGNASGAGAYGERRTAAYLHNTDRFLVATRGRAVAEAYRMLNRVGAARRLALAKARGDDGAAAYWRTMLAAGRRRATSTDRPAQPS